MAKKKLCRKCGGNLYPDGCRLCPLFAQGQTAGHAAMPACWPQTSMALGGHPKQLAELTERNRKHGCSVTYDRHGRAIIPDRKERKRLLRLEGMHDNSGCFGD